MNSMFAHTPLVNLEKIAHFNTNQVTDMGGLFQECKNLTDISAIEDWNTSSLVEFYYVFPNCKNLISVNLSNWDLSKVTNMSQLFQGCQSLNSVTMGGSVDALTNVSLMFDKTSSTGTFHYDGSKDYSKILAVVPSGWEKIAS